MSWPGALLALLALASCTGSLEGGDTPADARPRAEWSALLDRSAREAAPLDVPAIDAPGSDLTARPELKPKPPDTQVPPSRIGLGKIVGGAYTVSQPYGPTTFNFDYSYCKAYGTWPASQNVHCAIDLSIPRGTPLYAGEAGTIITAGGTAYFKDDLNPAAGELRLQLVDGTHVIYGHTSKIEVAKGAKVSVGQRVGLSGTAGTGAHLHLEVRVPDSSLASGFRTVDPMVFFGP